MKWNFMAKTVAALVALLGMTELPVNGEAKELDLTAEQRQKIVDALGEKMAGEAINGINSEIKSMADNNLNLKAIQDEIDALVLETNLTEEELKNIAKNEKGDNDMLATLQAISLKQKEQAAIIEKLVNEPEGDKPQAIINGNATMRHSATHLFASNKQYDAFEGGRDWNARALNHSAKATDFNKTGVIPLLEGDCEHFINENNGLLSSLFNDFRDLPAEWDRRSGVIDRLSDGYIMPDEIVQGRSKGWKPKNNFNIGSEAGRVFRKKIDIEFDGYELQEMENTWINSYNANDGSHPWKMSFIGFLLGELIKRRMLDDRIAQINGIWVQTPAGDYVPVGMNENSQDGLLYIWHKAREAGKYRAFDMGVPTEAGIVDYITNMIERIPEVDRKEQGMEIQLSSKWMMAYRKRAGEIYTHTYNDDQGKLRYSLNTPIDYPNFKFQELIDSTESDFIGITKSKNVQILDYRIEEKGKFTVTHEKRDTFIFADYRQGIRLRQIGNILEVGDARQFEMQKVWSNNVPVFPAKRTVPTFDYAQTGLVDVTYPFIEVDADFKTDITKINGALPGTVVKVRGNTKLVASKKLKKNANILIGTDFDLQSGGTITMFVQPDGKLKEMTRTSAPAVAELTDNYFDNTVLDATGNSAFRFNGTATKALANIINGVEGKTIKIYGTDTASVNFTLSTTGNVQVASAATLAKATDFVQLTNVGGTWVETDRSIIV